jgi:hypothetical protein
LARCLMGLRRTRRRLGEVKLRDLDDGTLFCNAISVSISLIRAQFGVVVK